MAEKCVNHLSIAEELCPDCGLEVDQYGNTEARFDYCCYPDCGCDGARNCDAKGEANNAAVALNREKITDARQHGTPK